MWIQSQPHGYEERKEMKKEAMLMVRKREKTLRMKEGL